MNFEKSAIVISLALFLIKIYLSRGISQASERDKDEGQELGQELESHAEKKNEITLFI